MHPQSREKRGAHEILNRGQGFEPYRLKKNLFSKKLQKVLVVQKKALPLHPLSKTKALKKSSLKDLDMNKQVVQDLLMKNE